MNSVKILINFGVLALLDFLSCTKVGCFIKRSFLDQIRKTQKVVYHDGVRMVFATPNELCTYRAVTFSIKEPETLEWIDGFREGAVLWDIGANVGLYSIYAAKRRGCRVFAFEPSIFNLECLGRNSFLNAVTDQVTLMPFALSDQIALSPLHMTSTDLGGALSTFDKTYGHDGRKLQEVFRFTTLGVPIDDVVRYLGIPAPTYIKLDVDGIEHLILRGGTNTLSKTQEILIEVNDDFTALSVECAEMLRAAGLQLREKRQGVGMGAKGIFQNTYNQIWCRPK